MTTVVNNPGPASTDSANGSAGWVVAVIILIIVIAGGAFAWARYHRAAAPATSNGGDNINITVPTPGLGDDSQPPSDQSSPPQY